MFNEKTTERSAKSGKDLPVWQTPKYLQSKEKAKKAMEQYPFLCEGDFWILMNETKTGKMAYTGLIISHNACLKINDNLSDKDKFKPECVTVDKEGYGGSLVFTYCCKEQGLYEVGEASPQNCKNAYPYAMGYKRLFDRVVLKQCKMAFDGIYSDSEADEFKEPLEELNPPKIWQEPTKKSRQQQFFYDELESFCKKYNGDKKSCIAKIEQKLFKSIIEFTDEDYSRGIDQINVWDAAYAKRNGNTQ